MGYALRTKKYTGNPTMIASEDNRSSAVTSLTRFRAVLVPRTDLAPSATPWTIFSVLSVTEWHAISTFARTERPCSQAKELPHPP
jgi:hypothetical protein